LTENNNIDVKKQFNEELSLELINHIDYGRIYEAKKIIERDDINFNQKDINGDTPLIRASYHGHSKIVGKLVEAGADLNLQDKHGNTSLAWASSKHDIWPSGKGHNKIVGKLIEAGADLNLQNSGGHTPLMHAAINHNTKVINKLIEAGADLNLQSKRQHRNSS